MQTITVTQHGKAHAKEVLVVDKIVAFTPMQSGCMIKTVNGTYLVSQDYDSIMAQIKAGER